MNTTYERRLVAITPDMPMNFRREKVTPMRLHWDCEEDGCDGEMLSAGYGMTTMTTSWLHRCNKCGNEMWADRIYPRIVYEPSAVDE